MLDDIIILAGGLGTRLASVSNGAPKSLMPVADRVFIDFIFNWLSKFAPHRVLLSLYFKPEYFFDYLSQRNFAYEVVPIVEPELKGTGGAIKYVIENVEISDHFGVLNGDTLVDFNYLEMVNHFYYLESKAMLGLTYMREADRYGTVKFEDNCALSFSEKKSNQTGWINNGCYILSREIMEPYSGKFSIELDVFPELSKNNELNVFKTSGSFIDIGVPTDYEHFLKENNGNSNTRS
jgi:D-glycero-alpha-D-manno-heptose 1-phosphate guanylyltransferase